MQVLEITEEGLKKLDFTPEIPCSIPECGQLAAKVIRCRKYPALCAQICAQHLVHMRLQITLAGMCSCSGCSDMGRTLEAVADVIDL